MTLSILIPVFNEDAQGLVAKSLEQVSALQVSAEIVVADDHSTGPMPWLQTVAAWPNVRVCHNARNIGRAANRNNLARMARGEWLLFLDAGNTISDPKFLQTYFEARHLADFIVGGCCVSESTFSKECSLRWHYEHASAISYQQGFQNHDSLDQWPFRSAAFMARREVLQAIAFDESLKGYGYEDVLFGIEARRLGFSIAHIYAPIELGNIETNELFLAKTEEALRTLRTLRTRIASQSRLLRHVSCIKCLHLAPLLRLLYRTLRKRLRRNLLSPTPSLRIFAFYKLGYFLSIDK